MSFSVNDVVIYVWVKKKLKIEVRNKLKVLQLLPNDCANPIRAMGRFRGGSINPIQTRWEGGADYASHITTSPPDSKSYIPLCDLKLL